jgi:hypothetical protein
VRVWPQDFPYLHDWVMAWVAPQHHELWLQACAELLRVEPTTVEVQTAAQSS